MPEALLFQLDHSRESEVEELCTALNIQTSTTDDSTLAANWTTNRRFDFVVTEASKKPESMQEIAQTVWRKIPNARVIFLADPAKLSSLNRYSFRMLGFDIIPASDGLLELASLLKGSLSSKNDKNFEVLVVEDLDSPREIICAFIESLGFTGVTGAASAKEALAKLKEDPNQFGCVITDINMPEVSGVELTSTIRNTPTLTHLPIVVLTAFGTVDNLIGCLQAGASGFLVKPPKKDDLLREIGRAIRIGGSKSSPRLAEDSDIEALRDALLRKGFA